MNSSSEFWLLQYTQLLNSAAARPSFANRSTFITARIPNYWEHTMDWIILKTRTSGNPQSTPVSAVFSATSRSPHSEHHELHH